MTLWISHEEQVLPSQATDIPLVPVHWQCTPVFPLSWVSYHSVCSPAHPPCNTLDLFSRLPEGLSCGHFMGCEESEWIFVGGWLCFHKYPSKCILSSLLYLWASFILGRGMWWPKSYYGQDSNFFRSVSSTILFYVWTLIAHDHQVSMRQETLHINCYFTYIWLFVVFPCCISPYCIYKLLEGKLPWIFISFNTCSMDHWVSRHSVPPHY